MRLTKAASQLGLLSQSGRSFLLCMWSMEPGPAKSDFMMKGGLLAMRPLCMLLGVVSSRSHTKGMTSMEAECCFCRACILV